MPKLTVENWSEKLGERGIAATLQDLEAALPAARRLKALAESLGKDGGRGADNAG